MAEYFRIDYEATFPTGKNSSNWRTEVGKIYVSGDDTVISRVESGVRGCKYPNYYGLYNVNAALIKNGVYFISGNSFSGNISSLSKQVGLSVWIAVLVSPPGQPSGFVGLDGLTGKIEGCGSIKDVSATYKKFTRNISVNNTDYGLIKYNGSKIKYYKSHTEFIDGDNYLSGVRGVLKFYPAPKTGYVFKGWEGGDESCIEGDSYLVDCSTLGNIEVKAVFKKIRLVTYTFKVNESGSPIPSSSNGTDGDTINLPSANATTRTGYVLDGWKINGTTYAAGSEYTFTDDDVTAVAVWRRVYFDVSITNTNTSAGTISLLRNGETVATESDGVLSYEGEANALYTIKCEPKTNLYAPLGISKDGEYVQSFMPAEGASLEYTYDFKKRNTYSILLDFDSQSGNVEIVTPSDETVGGVDKWLENRIEVAISPKTEDGWKFKIANIVNGNIVDSSYTSLTDGKLGFTLGFDTNVKVEFELARYTYKAEVDRASEGSVTGVSASAEEESSDGKVDHGQFVRFSATISGGYSFAGWYDGDILVSSSNPYNCEILKDTVLTAKAKVSVSLSVETEDVEKENPPVLSVNGEVCEDNQYSSDIVLGESLSYSLDKGDWFFDSWYSGGTPVPLPMEDKLTPTAAMNLVAKFTATKLKRTLTVKVINTSDGIPITDPELIKSSVAPTPPSGAGLQGTPSPGTYSFEFEGTQYVRVSAEEVAGDLPFNFFAGSTIEGGLPDVASILSREKDYDFLLNANRTIYACYGELANVTTRFTFAVGSDRTMGEILVDSDNAVPDADGSVTVEAIQQSMIAVTVRTKNGYEFVGWYQNNLGNGDVLDDSAEANIPVTTQRTIYAVFQKNTHAVYEWEGSAENKMMEWRSKVYAAPVPFNPSAARVDARGYGVELEVGMYSSPDGNPTRKSEIVVRDQNARRLPTLRPERYMQICVKNDAEVDAVIVGTSMKGLAV